MTVVVYPPVMLFPVEVVVVLGESISVDVLYWSLFIVVVVVLDDPLSISVVV
jgi:hypothetical protein